MKKHIITALLITAMISMTACGKNNTDTPAEETVVATSESVENPTVNDEKVVLGTVNKEETATAETTAAEEKTDAKATTSPDPKTTEAPKSTAAPETTAKPKSIETPKATAKPNTQASATTTATTKPVATEKPQSTTAPAPKATAAPKATPAPTAAPVACQHTNTHVESSHDTYEVPIAGGCYEVWVNATRVCNDCGANLGEAPEKVNEVHTNVVHKQGVSATCTTDGYSAVYGCDCGSQPEVGGDVIPAFGHDYKEVFDHSEEIPNDDGISVTTKFYYVNVCRNCGDTSAPYEK